MTGVVAIRPFRGHDRAAVDALLDARWAADPTMRRMADVHGRLPLRPDLVGGTLVAEVHGRVAAVGSVAGSTWHPGHLFLQVDVGDTDPGVPHALFAALEALGDGRPFVSRSRDDDAAGLARLRSRGFHPRVRTLDRTVDPAAPEARAWASAVPPPPAGLQIVGVGAGFGAAAPVEHVARAHVARYRGAHAWATPAPMSTAEAVARFCGPDVVPGSSVAAIDRRRRIHGVAELIRSPVRPERALLVWVGLLDEHDLHAEPLSAALVATAMRAAAGRRLLVDVEVDDTAPATWRAAYGMPSLERRPEVVVLTTG